MTTTPTRTRSRARTGAPRTEQRGAQGRGRTNAAERAYARRAQRAAEAVERTPDQEAADSPRRALVRKLPRLRLPASRASFVLLMMGLLATGVATTLWLSTQAIADSYRLDQLRKENAGLVERAEQLQREVTKQESTSSLDQRAKSLGMVPGGDPARILVNPDGSITVVGEPKKAEGPASPVQTPPDGGEEAPPPPAPAMVEGDQPQQPEGQQQNTPENPVTGGQ